MITNKTLELMRELTQVIAVSGNEKYQKYYKIIIGNTLMK